MKVSAASGPNYRNQPNLPQPNPHWTPAQGSWSWDFADRMHVLLADELDELASELLKNQLAVIKTSNEQSKKTIEIVSNVLDQQRRWIREFNSSREAHASSERTRLEILWWAEALYSQSMKCGYRSLPPSLAAVTAAFDLIEQTVFPSPASFSYLLAEIVAKLPGASFEQPFSLGDILGLLRQNRTQVTSGWLLPQYSPPDEGKLSLRDCVWVTLADRGWDPENTLQRAGVGKDTKLTLPSLAQTVFRQEQAVRLAGGEE